MDGCETPAVYVAAGVSLCSVLLRCQGIHSVLRVLHGCYETS